MAVKSVYTERYGAFLSLVVSARRNADLTQQELADQLGRPQSYVSKYERGERRLDVIEFLDIVKILDVDACTLLRELQVDQNRLGGGV